MGVLAQQTPENQILPIAPAYPDLPALTKWAADITRTLQQNLASIARKANDTSTVPLTGDLNAGGFSITNINNLGNIAGTITYKGADIDARYVNVTGDTMTGGLVLPAGTTTVHPLNIPHGVAATAPINGDLWSTTASFFARVNGATKTLAVLEDAQTFTGGITFSAASTFAAPISLTGASTQLIVGSTTAAFSLGNPAIVLGKRVSGASETIGFSDGAGGYRGNFGLNAAGSLDIRIGDIITTDLFIGPLGALTLTGGAISGVGALTIGGAFSGATTVTGSGNFNTTSGTFQINGTAIPFVKQYESAQQTISVAGTLTLAHGLGVKPKLYFGYAQCTTAENGYSIGDEILVGEGYSGTNGQNYVCVPDATNLVIRFGSGGNPISTIHKTTGVGVFLTNANWRFVMRAWA